MKRGFTLLSLIATIAIMAILLTTVTVSGIATVNNANKMSFASEISLLQESTNAYIAKNNGAFPIGDSVQLNISGVTPASQTQFGGETITASKLVLYKLDYKLLGITSLKNGLSQDGPEDMYVVSKDTKRVYYAKGMAVGSTTYYTLTDDLKGLINYKTNGTQPLTNDGVIFEPSIIGWTKQNVTVQVKIPKNYVSKTVTANGTPVTLTSTDATYDLYNVTGIAGNYAIVANFAVNATSPITNSKFDVNNVDTVAPVLSLDKLNQQLLKSDNSSESSAYFKILQKTDALSGVKSVKYENERIKDAEIETYFKTNGKNVYKDIVPIDKDVREITVYIEDNAGNWTADFVTVKDTVYTGLL